jgi:hypothetical protein
MEIMEYRKLHRFEEYRELLFEGITSDELDDDDYISSYETQEYNLENINLISKFIDDCIGVDYEKNKDDNGIYYIVVFECTDAEIRMLTNFENNINNIKI